MINDIQIGTKKIGLDQDIFICAEVGTTCNGDVKTAKKLIDAAKYAGMDAVKFQIWNVDAKYSCKNINYTYIRHNGKIVTENIYKMMKKYEMPFNHYKEIYSYSKKKNIIMFATPLYMEAIDMMEKLNMPAYKIATWDVTFRPFVEKIANFKKPTIIDLGASDKEEVASILKIFKKAKNNKIILLHCFHTNNYNEMNLRSIEYLRETFGCLSGFSAPDNKNKIDFVSLVYKPVYIEKRLTLNKKDLNHHHCLALEPSEMKQYVDDIRNLSKARGLFDLIPTKKDLVEREKHFTSIVAGKNIKKGEKLSLKNLACKRPLLNRLDPKYLEIIVGRIVKKDIKENEPITWAMV